MLQMFEWVIKVCHSELVGKASQGHASPGEGVYSRMNLIFTPLLPLGHSAQKKRDASTQQNFLLISFAWLF